MSKAEEIVRIAARGDGITASGKHVPGTAPADVLQPDGTITRGPHYTHPACKHFGVCGGCELQHIAAGELARFVHQRVANAAVANGLDPAHVADAVLSPTHSRRRASFRAINGGGRPFIGFTQSGSHKIVDLAECHILLPELFDLLPPLKTYFGQVQGRYSIDIEMTAIDQGVDLGLKGFAPEGLDQTEELLDFCREQKLARLTLDQGYGAEPFWEPEPVTATLGGVPVAFPAGAFLQPTIAGESALVAAAQEWLDGCLQVADLFAGLGTFALSLAANGKILAAEADKAAILALRNAANARGLPVETSHRDLFRNPIRADELSGYDGVLLDPPRAGARAQVEQIAASGIERVVYISCNPSSWGRDSAQLKGAGYDLIEIRPVGQFVWSTHVELASLFIKR